jgi:hypothetical protein
MGVSLTELAIKRNVTAVTNKIKAIKDEKNTEKLRNTNDEIVSELLSERDDTGCSNNTCPVDDGNGGKTCMNTDAKCGSTCMPCKYAMQKSS